MSNPLASQHVVSELRPMTSTGQANATYELTRSSVNPSRIVGRDDRGMPIVDTLPTVYWRPFLMLDGCINKVPLRTGSVPSMHQDAIAYENETVHDLVTAGAIPAWLCPYSTKFQHIVGGPFATPPAGKHDCGGSTGDLGCEHLQAIAAARRAGVLENYNKEMQAFSAQRDVEYARMREELVSGIGAAVGQALAANVAPQDKAAAARQRLRDAKDE